ncbi:hypothetical protein K1719_008659 [Acacia pycnantha]|nr:hypothetical protein K1719_008659 [Acacia pycnantha]
MTGAIREADDQKIEEEAEELVGWRSNTRWKNRGGGSSNGRTKYGGMGGGGPSNGREGGKKATSWKLEEAIQLFLIGNEGGARPQLSSSHNPHAENVESWTGHPSRCKKYPSMELWGLFQYLVNQLKKDSNPDFPSPDPVRLFLVRFFLPPSFPCLCPSRSRPLGSRICPLSLVSSVFTLQSLFGSSTSWLEFLRRRRSARGEIMADQAIMADQPIVANQDASVPTTGQSASASVTNKASSVVTGKRKAMKQRSKVWDHFSKFVNEKGDIKGKCNYCEAVLACDPKNNGTTALNNHFANVCKKKPPPEELKQCHLNYSAEGDKFNLVN